MLRFRQFCKIEEESTSKKMEKAYQQKQRDKKIKKLLSIESRLKRQT